MATGGTVSRTVTVAVQVLWLLLLSVTVKVTVLEPIFEQVKLVGLAEMLWILHASLLPLFTSFAVIEAFPLPSR